MLFEDVQVVFKQIWDDLPFSEQARLVHLMTMPRLEPFRAADMLKRRGGKNGPDDNSNKKVTNAVAGVRL